MIDTPPPPPPPEQAIVITAQALPNPAAERAHHVDRLDRYRLANGASSQLDQILKESAGLQLFRRSDARSGHPSSQGVTFRALGGNASSRAMMILDGVPQADPFGGWVNWPSYDPASLAEVRIVRGGGSVVAGPGALAGVIDMTSGFGEMLAGSLFAGSRRSVEGRASAGVDFGGGRLGLTVRGERGDGFIPITRGTRGPVDRAAPYKAASGRALWVGSVAALTEVQLAASAFTDRRHRGVDFTDNRTDGVDASVRLVGRGAVAWSALAYGQWRAFSSSFASVGAERSTVSRASLQDEVPASAYGGAVEARPMIGGVELRLGADARLADGETRELFAYVAGAATRQRVAGGRSLTAGVFAEAVADLGRLSLSGGARLDRWRIWDGELRERVIATGAPLRDELYSSRSGWLPTIRAGAVLAVSDALSLRSAAYLGWRMPTLNELFRPFRAGPDATAANPMLDPERLRGIEAGLDLRRDELRLSLTAFANRLRGPIANVTLGQGPGTFPGVGFVAAGGDYRQRQNLDAVDVHGVEANGEVRRGPWTLRGSASLTDAAIDAEGPANGLDGLRPAQTPRFTASFGVGWDDKGRSLSLTIRRVGSQFEDDLNQRLLPLATILDGSAAWPVTRGVDLLFRAENLLNERVVAGIGGDGSVERATPRTLWLGLRFGGRR
ncbi:MAG TPA: TonB-dependent receptor [Sphingomicrobium sp.]|nr:TonB-dependent receptor [Sphingomicrobium sp.]